LATRGRSPPRTAVGARVAPPSDDPANASPDDRRDQLLDAFSLPSQPLTAKVLRRPVESAQYLSIRYTQRLAEAGAVTSVGSRGDSYDNALAETIIGLYKTELVRRRGPWRGIDDLEYATLEWVDWFNHRRLLEPIGHVPPAEFEAAFWREEDPSYPVRLRHPSLQ
jgi:transposase InsO family protein